MENLKKKNKNEILEAKTENNVVKGKKMKSNLISTLTRFRLSFPLLFRFLVLYLARFL